jgi:3-phenylpropionate/trans-cinnamate dioxygenase ferredoxin subunit
MRPGDTRRIEAGDVCIALFNVRGTLYALDDSCTHAGGALSDGDVDSAKCVVECPLHFARFELRTGRPLGPPAEGPVAVHSVDVRDGIIFVAKECVR